jgi:hypothetical protein
VCVYVALDKAAFTHALGYPVPTAMAS